MLVRTRGPACGPYAYSLEKLGFWALTAAQNQHVLIKITRFGGRLVPKPQSCHLLVVRPWAIRLTL